MGNRAQHVGEQLTSLATSGLDSKSFGETALNLIRRAVPFESACLASCDPATEMLTGTVKVDLPDARDAEFAHYEYEVEDVNSFREISRRSVPVGVLHLDTGGRPERSPRWRDFLVPHFDQGHELRAALKTGAATWGLLGLYRPTQSGGFSAAEADFIARISGVVAVGLRAGLIAGVTGQSAASNAPAVLIVDRSGTVIQASGAATQRVAELGGDIWGALPTPLAAVVAGARGFAGGHLPAPPSARIRTANGQWLMVHASPLASPSGSAGDIALTLEQARPPEVIPLVVAAYGLTDRERDVVRLVFAGSSTQQIATQLHLSPYTVQDHLKSVFAKVGVTSRREVIARIFFEQYAPQIDTPLDSAGWFTGTSGPAIAGEPTDARAAVTRRL